MLTAILLGGSPGVGVAATDAQSGNFFETATPIAPGQLESDDDSLNSAQRGSTRLRAVRIDQSRLSD